MVRDGNLSVPGAMMKPKTHGYTSYSTMTFLCGLLWKPHLTGTRENAQVTCKHCIHVLDHRRRIPPPRG